VRKSRSNNMNPGAGAKFEKAVQKYFLLKHKLALNNQVSFKLGVGKVKKLHRFDLASVKDRVIVECKSYTWTAGGNSPSAKFGFLNEVMFYFHLAPKSYRKLLVMRNHTRKSLSLAQHYIKNHKHLFAKKVEVWELAGSKAERIF